jgi:hypothetical protein
MKAKMISYCKFYSYLVKNAAKYDVIWIGVWDYKFIDTIARFCGFRGKIVYHFHELETEKYKYCRRADFCVIPEENRSWITFFEAKLQKLPLYLPNIPYLNYQIDMQIPEEIKEIRKKYKTIVLYQGLIDFTKRCLNELLDAFVIIDSSICLIIMPMPNTPSVTLELLEKKLSELNLSNRVFILASQIPPFHLQYIKHVDIGIGMYRPTSLNQIYAAPNRLFEFGKFNVPIILPNFPAFKGLSYKYPYAINAVDPESGFEIASSISALCNTDNLETGRLNMGRFFADNGDYETFVKNNWKKIEKELC